MTKLNRNRLIALGIVVVGLIALAIIEPALVSQLFNGIFGGTQ